MEKIANYSDRHAVGTVASRFLPHQVGVRHAGMSHHLVFNGYTMVPDESTIRTGTLLKHDENLKEYLPNE